MRVSDRERDQTTEILRAAMAEGRLPMDEFQERLDHVYAAKTYADLALVTRDLPDVRPGAAPAPAMAPLTGGRLKQFAIAFMSGFRKGGNWRAPEEFTGIAFMGGGEVDLRDADIGPRGITIRAFAFMGGIQVTVPEDAEVEVHGFGFMGGFDDRAAGAGAPGSPLIKVIGFAMMGGVDVRRKPRRDRGLRR